MWSGVVQCVWSRGDRDRKPKEATKARCVVWVRLVSGGDGLVNFFQSTRLRRTDGRTDGQEETWLMEVITAAKVPH